MSRPDGIHTVTMRSVAEMDEFMSRSYAPVRSTPMDNAHFSADIRVHRAADVTVGSVRAEAHVLERTGAMIGEADQEFVNIAVLASGRGVVRQFDREAVVSAGEIFMTDPDVPYAFDFDESFELIYFLFPRRMIGLSSARLHSLAARRLQISEPLSRIALGFVRMLEEDLTNFTPRSANRLLRNAIDVLATVVDEAAATAAHLIQGAERDIPLSERARTFIEANLADPDLSPQTVADALFISTRHLHGVFSNEGETVAEYIRHRRIERCRRDLTDPDLAGLTVSEIGARWGFDDASHFSRTFRREEGMPPSEYRRRHS